MKVKIYSKIRKSSNKTMQVYKKKSTIEKIIIFNLFSKLNQKLTMYEWLLEDNNWGLSKKERKMRLKIV